MLPGGLCQQGGVRALLQEGRAQGASTDLLLSRCPLMLMLEYELQAHVCLCFLTCVHHVCTCVCLTGVHAMYVSICLLCGPMFSGGYTWVIVLHSLCAFICVCVRTQHANLYMYI